MFSIDTKEISRLIDLSDNLEVADVEAPFTVLDDGDGDAVEVVLVVGGFEEGVGVAAYNQIDVA